VRFYFNLFANALRVTSARHDIPAKSTDETIIIQATQEVSRDKKKKKNHLHYIIRVSIV